MLASERLSGHDLAVVDEELCWALTGAADYGQQSGELLTRDQAQSAAFGTGKHGPVRVIFFSDAASVLQHEDRARETGDRRDCPNLAAAKLGELPLCPCFHIYHESAGLAASRDQSGQFWSWRRKMTSINGGIRQSHIVRTTRNCALPLIMRP